MKAGPRRTAARRPARAQAARDEAPMRRALALAERGRGTTRPNPVVGAVVVRAGRIVAEGFHRRAGLAHAEIVALRRAGARARGATLYVTLEPCCHVGRTGPCTEAILAAGVARVVVGCRDANPRVDGRGLARLRRAGVRVDVGCLEEEAREVNRGFLTWIRSGRPWVTLKAAATLDGFIAAADGSSTWITGEAARREVHRMRARHDAILVGAGTVRADDPLLTVRLRGRRRSQPLRVVLDGALRTPAVAQVLRPVAGAPPTLVVGARGASPVRARALARAGAEVALLPGRAGRVDIAVLLALLGRRGIQSLLVEGGAAVHGAFIDAGRFDRTVLFVAPKLLGRGVPIAAGVGRPLGRARALARLRAAPLGGDILLVADAPEARR